MRPDHSALGERLMSGAISARGSAAETGRDSAARAVPIQGGGEPVDQHRPGGDLVVERRRRASRSGSGWMVAPTRLPSGLAEPTASMVSVSPRCSAASISSSTANSSCLRSTASGPSQQALVQAVQQVGVLGTGQHGRIAVGDRLADLRPDLQGRPGCAAGRPPSGSSPGPPARSRSGSGRCSARKTGSSPR